MEAKDIENVLKIILKRLKSKEFTWRLEGSANLLIQDVEVSVKDLDITTNDEGIKIFRAALKEFIVKDFFNEKVKGASIVCNINGFEIELNSYKDRKLDMFDKTQRILWQGLEIPILPLKDAKRFYELIGRKEKVELIEKHLRISLQNENQL